mmetsp:Transcript_134248/g.388630  ORF Transcript_134248/g.388630 Transcript_134248/m.388630 type:complete len:449 (-) Transcript_134248:48-1394(-)
MGKFATCFGVFIAVTAQQKGAAFQTSRLPTNAGVSPESLIVLSDFRRRRNDRYYPDDREYQIIDTKAYDDGRGYRYDDRGARPRDNYGALGDYYSNDISFAEGDDIARHLWIVVWATCWWYVYNGLMIVAHPPPVGDKAPYFFKMDKETMQLYGAFLAFLPVPIYSALSRLAKSYTLQEAQFAVAFLALSAVPAYAIISVFNPLHNRSWGAVGLFETTMFIGAFVAHHLRQAALREGPQPAEKAVRFERAEIASEAIEDYRPPIYYQSTQVAAKLSRDFVSFHVALSVITASLISSKENFFALFPFNSDLWAWVLVLIHMGHSCFVTALFPGAQLNRFRTYVLADSALYAVHIYAAISSPTVQQWLSNPEGQVSKPHAVLGDQILVLWFVADAAMQLIGPLGRILQSIDFDEKFNLVPYGGRDPLYYDDEFVDSPQQYLPPGAPPPRR